MATDEWVRKRPGPDGYRRDALAALALMIGAALSSLLHTRVGWYNDPAPLLAERAGRDRRLTAAARLPAPLSRAPSRSSWRSPSSSASSSWCPRCCSATSRCSWRSTPSARGVVIDAVPTSSRGFIIAAMLVWVVVNVVVTVIGSGLAARLLPLRALLAARFARHHPGGHQPALLRRRLLLRQHRMACSARARRC